MDIEETNKRFQENRIEKLLKEKELTGLQLNRSFWLDILAVVIVSILLTNFSYKAIYAVIIFVFIRVVILSNFDK